MDKEFAQNIIKAQMDINLYLDDMLQKLNMDKLPEAEKKQMKKVLMTALEKFFLGAVIERASEEQMEEMNKALDEKGNIYDLMEYIAQNFDQDGKMMEKVLLDFQRVIIEKMNSKEKNNG